MPRADDTCLHDLVTEQATRTPDAVAVLADDGALRYAELVARANRLAHRLRERGVGVDTPVGVVAERGVDLVVALLGVLVAGGAYVPLDPDLPAERLGYQAGDADPPVLLAQRHLVDRIPNMVAERWCVIDESPERWPATPPEPLATVDSLAYVIYTSGSTGRPKGVCVPHRGIVNRVRWMQDAYRLNADDVVLQKTPYGFDVSVWEFFWPLAAGARLVLARPGGHRDPAYLAATVAAYGVTTLHFVPTMLAQFLAEPDLPPLPTVRRVICSGEALPVAVAREAIRRIPGELHNLYGPTEASVDVSAHRVRPPVEGASVPIGAPIANVSLHVLDDRLDPVPVGVVGELYIGGVGLARGYHGRPGLTAERFVPDPGGSGRLYRTGDLARRLPDGEYDFVGRRDGQVKIRGNRVELGEVEQTLLTHDRVHEAAVIVRHLASGHPQLVAYVAPPGCPVAELRDHLARRLPDYMVPALLVHLEHLPVTPSGKTDRQALPAPTGATVGAGTATGGVPAKLAALWASVLERDGVGPDDDFFTLGGDSVLAMRVVALARRSGLRLSTRQLFTYRTVAALAPHVESTDPTAVDDPALLDGPAFALSPVDPALLTATPGGATERAGVTVVDAYPLTPMQEGMLFHTLLAPDEADYLQQHVYRLDRSVDVAALADAWRAAFRRHPALRSTVRWDGVAEPVQLVHEGHPPEVRVLDGQTDTALLLAAERRAGLDLGAAPPVRVTLIPRATDRTDLVLTFHHLLLDGWSLAVLLAEVLDDRREPVVPFRRYLRWLADADRSTGYWKRLLAGFPESTPLPHPPASAVADAADARPQVGLPGTAVTRLVLPDRLGTALAARAAAAGVTPYAVTLGAWALTLAGYVGRDDVVVGVTVAGRPDDLPGAEAIVGLLINTVPLRVRFEPDAPFTDALHAVQAQQVAARESEHQSLADITRASEVPPGSPLFHSIVVFQNHPPLPAGLSPVDVVESTGYPLTLIVEPTPELVLRLLIEGDALAPTEGGRLLAAVRRVLEVVVAHPNATTREVRAALTPR
ncbi:amino acid adenylation domain-containing protein [Micromonospora sp. CPCC 205539]|uniref:amino acid adenylation domain-containing protein n=1 Tax=Micromonospora sp. CPCC 205539 TaxID=3122408 RepID=UPI002FEF95A7